MIFSISTLFTALSSFILGIFVILKNWKSRQNILWGLTSFSVAIWSLGLYGVINSSIETEALFWNKILYLGAIFIPIFFYHFVLIFLNLNREERFSLTCFYLVAFIFQYFNFTSKKFIKGSQPFGQFNFWVTPGGWIYYSFFVFFTLMIILSFYKIIKNYKFLLGIKKQQSKYILLAACLGFSGGITNFFPQLIGVYPIGNYLVILYVVAIFYAILKYRLLGIRLVLSRIFFYFFLLFFFVIFQYSIFLISWRFFKTIWSVSFFIFIFMGSIFLAIFYMPVYKYFNKLSDYIFYNGQNPKNLLNKIISESYKQIKLKNFCLEIIERLRQVLDFQSIVFIAIVPPAKIIAQNNFDSINLFQISSIIKNTKLIIRDEFNPALNILNKKIYKEMIQNNIQIISPILFNKTIIGIILLGEKKDKEGYTKEEIDFIEDISSGLTIALANAIKLERSNQTNIRLNKSQKDFLNIISDKIRTPIYKINNILKLADKKGLSKFQGDNSIGLLHQRTESLVKLVDNAVLASQIDSANLQFDLVPTNLSNLLNEVINAKKGLINRQITSLTLNIEKDNIMVLSNRIFLARALDNLIDNAFRFSLGGNVNIILKIDKQKVKLKIIDTGIGIPEEDVEKIFNKFTKAGNYKLAYENGLGLGLYVAKNIVKAHEGAKLYIEKTSIKEGTVFATEFLIFNKKD